MSESRSNTIQKLVKTAKKNYPVVKPPADRGVLDTLIYACLLEDSDFDATDEAFARLEQYADWNEVRVSTVSELTELMAGLTRPAEAAERLKNVLHSVFETHYSFDLDFLIKESQGKAVALIEKYIGATPFTVGYVIQNSLDGHKIPVSQSILELANALGLVSPKDQKNVSIPGIDRAVPKSKGPELFSTVHQFAVAYEKSPFSTEVRKLILEVSPDAKDRLKKRPSKKTAKESSESTPAKTKKATASKSTSKADKPSKTESSKSPTKKATTKKATSSKPATKKSTTKKSAAKKAPTKKSTTKKSAKAAPKKKTTKKKAAKTTTKKSATKKTSAKSKTSRKLSKKKPR